MRSFSTGEITPLRARAVRRLRRSQWVKGVQVGEGASEVDGPCNGQMAVVSSSCGRRTLRGLRTGEAYRTPDLYAPCKHSNQKQLRNLTASLGQILGQQSGNLARIAAINEHRAMKKCRRRPLTQNPGALPSVCRS